MFNMFQNIKNYYCKGRFKTIDFFYIFFNNLENVLGILTFFCCCQSYYNSSLFIVTNLTGVALHRGRIPAGLGSQFVRRLPPRRSQDARAGGLGTRIQNERS